MVDSITHRSVMAITYSFPPMRGSGSIRNLKFISGLDRLGWKIRVLTVQQRYCSDVASSALMESTPEGIEIVRTKCFYTQDFVVRLKHFFTNKTSEEKKHSLSENNSNDNEKVRENRSKSKTQRLKDFITDAITIPDKEVGWLPFGLFAGMKSLQRTRVDVVYAVGKPWTGFFIGYFLKRIYKIPLVIDFMDPWTQNPFNPSKGRLLDKVQSFLEEFIVKHADLVIANTEELGIDFIKRLKASEDNVRVLTCGYDENDFPLKKNYDGNRNRKLVVTHIGTFYGERNPVPFLKAVKHLINQQLIPKETIRINFIGSQLVTDPQLPSLLLELSTADVLYQESWVPHRKAIDYLYASDILLLVQPKTCLQIPAKLYEYIFVQKPILAISEKNGATDNIINREGWGKSTENDVNEISNALYEFYCRFQAGELLNYVNPKNIPHYSVSELSLKLQSILFEAGKYEGEQGTLS